MSNKVSFWEFVFALVWVFSLLAMLYVTIGYIISQENFYAVQFGIFVTWFVVATKSIGKSW